MAFTTISGYSDDLVVVEHTWNENPRLHELYEIPCPDHKQCRILFEDGTCITVSYGKGTLAVWHIFVNCTGTAAHTLAECNDENASVYSDVFKIESAIKRHVVVERRKHDR